MNAGENREYRAGRYVQQPTGYRAFIPAALPPQPPIDLSGPLRELLSKADYALGRLDGAVLTLPNPDLFVFMYVRKEAVLSSQIEGTQSSLQNLLAAEARLNDPDTPADVAEVVNYVRAMNHGLARLAELPVSVRLIREIHTVLMRGVRGGRLTPGNSAPARTGSVQAVVRCARPPSSRRRPRQCRRRFPISSVSCTPKIRRPL
jgi:cell filamentation protein, protein adenylyltransferase